MSEIQIDVYDVQLGASVLLQFKTAESTVRVLADAGLFHGSPRTVEYVRDELIKQFPDENPIRIDLIIGTHYDADHLLGLVPIIQDNKFDIGEAWMPPVANDTLEKHLNELPNQDDLLAHQFYKSSGEDDLISYFKKKENEILPLKALIAKPSIENLTFKAHKQQVEENKYFRFDFYNLTRNTEYFSGLKVYISDKELGGNKGLRETYHYKNDEKLNVLSFEEIYSHKQNNNDSISDLDLKKLINAKANDAITASNLYKVVKALACRNIPLKTEIIENGMPRRYVWDENHRRFIHNNIPSDKLELKLLGPSKEQIRKQWHKLPIEEQVSKTFSKLIKPVPVSASNQLSYIMRFGFQKQGILIAGDSGCDGFYNKKEDRYYQKLLDAMLPLHVVQVAHHGGANSQFYNVMLEAKYPEQTEASFLLLSHATNDKKRPSFQFKEFLLESVRHVDDIRVIFTAKPDVEKITDYRQYIHRNVGKNSDAGNAKLDFETNKWVVRAHAISFD